MSIKNFRSKLEEVQIEPINIPRMVFMRDNKYYTEISYSEEVDKALVKQHNITVIRFQ
jgi:hypothetical protein